MIDRKMMENAAVEYADAKRRYEEMKSQQIHDMMCDMADTGAEYTAQELADNYGLSIAAVVGVLRCRYLSWPTKEKYDLWGLVAEKVTREVVRKYVLMDEDGNIDPRRVKVEVKKITTYSVHRES